MQRIILAAAVFLLASTQVHAQLISFTGTVTVLEGTYLPGLISFIMNAGNATCPAGGYLYWKNSNERNNLAVYATLLTAVATGKPVRVYHKDGDTTCVIEYVHILQ